MCTSNCEFRFTIAPDDPTFPQALAPLFQRDTNFLPAMSTPAPPSAPPASGLSALFSLSQAAASAPLIPMHASGTDQKVSKDMPHHSVSTSVSGKPTHAVKHRRLSSAGQMRRRMSDAREAANRPSYVLGSTRLSAL